MTTALPPALIRLPRLPDGPAARPALGASAVFLASVRQDIRTVPIFSDCLVVVAEGQKEVDVDGRAALLSPGDGIALRAGLTLDNRNLPDERSGQYRALVLVFEPALIEAFACHYPAMVSRGGDAGWSVLSAGQLPLAAAVHAADGLASPDISDEVVRHRLFEVLLHLAEQGVRWPLPAAETAAQRLRVLLASRPAAPWTAEDAAKLLGVSEPTLRRRLAGEGTSFRDLLSEVRLSQGLTLLLTTGTGIAEIALRCGYESPSRFAARFRDRFGTTPSELRGERNGTAGERSRRAGSLSGG